MYSNEEVFLLDLLQKILRRYTCKDFCFGLRIDGIVSLYKDYDNTWYVENGNYIEPFVDFIDAVHQLIFIVCPDDQFSYDSVSAKFDEYFYSYNKSECKSEL